MAEQDLINTVFTVEHHKFEDWNNSNFFNGEFVTGRDGKKYYLTNGAPKEQKTIFSNFMKSSVEKVYFAAQEISRQGLKEQGGIGCRAKGYTVNKDVPGQTSTRWKRIRTNSCCVAPGWYSAGRWPRRD